MTRFEKGNNSAWFHEVPGLEEGFFHTYDNLRISQDDQARKVHIWLPRNYEGTGKPKLCSHSTETLTPLPVLYFHDGNTTFWPNGVSPHSWEVHSTLHKFWQSNEAKKVMVVAIYPIDRNREYTHDYWCPSFDYGGVSEYADYIVNKLKPWIDSNYHTAPDQRNTYILGSSHGGLASFIVSSLYPFTFNVAGCFSPSFWAAMGFDSLNGSSLLKLTSGGLQHKPKFFFTYGLVRSGGVHNLVIEQLTTSRTREMIDLLKEKYGYDDSNLVVFEDAQGKHEEITWQGQFQLFVHKFLRQ